MDSPNNNIADGIYYLVLADLAGSTAYSSRMGNEAFQRRIQIFNDAALKALTNAQTPKNSGRFVKSMADGMLYVFSHFPDVVQWWMELDGVLGLASIRDEVFEARMCVHVGEVRFPNGDPLSLAANHVFKMEKSVKVGDLVLTDLAYQLARSSLHPKDAKFEPYGTVNLPGHEKRVKLHKFVFENEMLFLLRKTGPHARKKLVHQRQGGTV